jgi:hypothetical protein
MGEGKNEREMDRFGSLNQTAAIPENMSNLAYPPFDWLAGAAGEALGLRTK